MRKNLLQSAPDMTEVLSPKPLAVPEIKAPENNHPLEAGRRFFSNLFGRLFRDNCFNETEKKVVSDDRSPGSPRYNPECEIPGASSLTPMERTFFSNALIAYMMRQGLKGNVILDSHSEEDFSVSIALEGENASDTSHLLRCIFLRDHFEIIFPEGTSERSGFSLVIPYSCDIPRFLSIFRHADIPLTDEPPSRAEYVQFAGVMFGYAVAQLHFRASLLDAFESTEAYLASFSSLHEESNGECQHVVDEEGRRI